jgi:hypothetical protein
MVRGDEVRVKSALAVPPNEVLQLGEIRQRKTHGIGGHCISYSVTSLPRYVSMDVRWSGRECGKRLGAANFAFCL